MLVGVIAVLLMATIERGDWMYGAGDLHRREHRRSHELVFYDSLLPHIAAKDEMDRVSTAGYAIGYHRRRHSAAREPGVDPEPGTFGMPDTVTAIKLSFVSVGVWWLLFSFPLLRRVPEPPRVLEADETRNDSAFRAGVRARRRDVSRAARLPQRVPDAGGVSALQRRHQTIIRMASVYGAEIGIDSNAQIAAFVHGAVRRRAVLVSVRCAGRSDRRQTGDLRLARGLHDRLDHRLLPEQRSGSSSCSRSSSALVQGGSQALSRSLFARMIPRHKSSEYFGFFSVFEKFSGIAGPAVFAGSVTLFGNSRAAVLSLILFFILGAVVLTRVNVREGEAQAAAASLQ